MISKLDNLIKIFEDMKNEGWDTSRPLKYGFYFIDPTEQKLHAVFEELKDHNYTLEKIYVSDDDDKWTLHVSKIDLLTPEKLDKRNIAFKELADHCQVFYDGWDVEKV